MPRTLADTRMARLLVVMLSCTAGLVLSPSAWGAAADGTFVVTSTGDSGDAGTTDNCSTGTGECTLRAAILAANAHPNVAGQPDVVSFAIPGAEPHVIAPTSALPVLTDSVTVDAGLPSAWAPRRVELSGAQCNPTGNTCEGLVVGASGITIRGLAVHEFFAGIRNVFGRGDGLVVEGNFIGTDAGGTTVLQRSFAATGRGVLLDHVTGVRVGGDPALGEGNLIAGHSSSEIDGVNATGLSVLGNYLGVAADGHTSLARSTSLRLEQSTAAIGSSARPNVIAGPDSGTAAMVLVNTPGTAVQDNFIGVDVTGTVRTGVGGVDVQSDRVLIGGPGQGNVISGGFGVKLQPNPATRASGGNVISHNFIGTDVTGTKAVPNGTGIVIADTGSTIEDNVIAGNTGDGIGMATTAGPGHRIVRNLIGVAADGSALGNGRFGVGAMDDYGGGGTVIGGTPADANTIAHNAAAGVAVGLRATIPGEPLPDGVTVRFNSILDNGSRGAPALGIDLPGDSFNNGSPDPIDDLDGDSGANDLQNAPEILSATTTSTSTVVNGRLRSAPGAQFDIDLYENPACDETGYGEAETFVATQIVTTAGPDSSTPGVAPFTFTVTPPLVAGHVLAATATNATGSTSELSRCGTAVPGARVSYTGPATVTYSDPAILSGRLETVTEPPTPISGKTLSLTLGSLSTVAAGPTGSDGTASTPVIVTLKPGPTAVSTAFAGDDVYNSATDTDPVTVAKESCTLLYTGDTSVATGTPSVLRAQFGESDDSPGDWFGHVLDFTVTSGSGSTTHHTATTDDAGLASTTVDLPSDARSVGVGFAGDDYYLPCATSEDTFVTVQPASTVVTYTGPAMATYSDPVTLGGRLEVAGTPPDPIAGRTLSFALDPMPAVTAGPTAADGSTATTPFAVTATPGQHTVTTHFAGDSVYGEATDTDTLTVLREECTLSYTGDLLVTPLALTTLRAQFGETDATPGDWAGHSVEFVVRDSSLTTTRYTTSTDTRGIAEQAVALPANAYSVGVTFAGDDFYNPCSTANETLFTVQQAGAKVTGGGWISTGIGRTSFGFNLIPQAGGAFSSQVQILTSDKNRFHGSGPATATVLSGNSVRWSGTGRWNGVTGYCYTLTVVDNGSSGGKKGDTIAVTVYREGDPAHPVLATGSQTLKGGNITVH